MPRFGIDDRHMRTEPLQIETEDHKWWDAMLFEPRGARRSGQACLVVHGAVGNYLEGFPRRLAFGLAERGHAVLSINTRMANYGALFGGGLLHRTPADIDAGVATLRRRGYKRVILCGYSMGATMVTRYQASDQAARGARAVHLRAPLVAARVPAPPLGALRRPPLVRHRRRTRAGGPG